MSEERMNVADIAKLLDVPTQDVLQALRKLDIAAKSTMSMVPSEYLDRLRAYFNSPEHAGNVRIRPGVVRRRRTRSGEAPSREVQGQEEKTEQVVTSASEKSMERARREEAPVEQPEGEKVTARQPRSRRAPRPVPPAARVISRPGAVSAVVPKPETEVAADIPAMKQPAAMDTAARQQEGTDAVPVVKEVPASRESDVARHHAAVPDASAEPEGSSAPTLPQRSTGELHPQASETSVQEGEGEETRRRRSKKTRQETAPATPQVRIISRPSPEAVQRIQENRAAAAGTGRPSRSGGNYRSGQGQRPSRNGAGSMSGTPFGAPAQLPGEREGQSKKKRNKGRRTVDFQQNFGDFGGRMDEDDAPRMTRSKARRKPNRDTRPQTPVTQPLKAAKRKIRVNEAIRVVDMAQQMGLKANEIIKVLFGLGVMATINQSLDIDTATLVAAEFEYEVEKVGFSEEDYLPPVEADAPELLRPRPPVVTIMGHVDHGKTSLLDAIRKSHVTSGEAGGITQHIGAYHVLTKRGEIVFLDTPGHEAFTAMRARGAQVTDLVVLVVAADDGVMDQTREAINHSRAAGVPIMVAVNKIDKPAAEPDRVLRELAELGLQAEDWGGDTVVARVSAKTGQGLDELLELIALQAEILELKANPDKPARGHIVEAKLDKGRGPVATVLIQEGTLHQGDTFVCGVFSGRVRALFNDKGKKVKEAGPAIPVEVQGFAGVPEAGEEFICVADEKLARRIADSRAVKQRERELARESRVTLETFLSRRADDQEALTLNLVVKTDVQGSLEAITEALLKQSTDKVRISVVHGGAGAISESDILLASASQAIIIGFNVRATAKIKEVAERENVDIRYYDIIYKLVDDIKSAMQGLLAPVQREVYLGQAEVRETFSVPKVGVIAGCHVSDGKVTRTASVRLLRDGVVAYTGKIASLKRFKDDAREVLKGYECGIGLENFNDIKIGDIIEAFEMIEEAATL